MLPEPHQFGHSKGRAIYRLFGMVYIEEPDIKPRHRQSSELANHYIWIVNLKNLFSVPSSYPFWFLPAGGLNFCRLIWLLTEMVAGRSKRLKNPGKLSGLFNFTYKAIKSQKSFQCCWGAFKSTLCARNISLFTDVTCAPAPYARHCTRRNWWCPHGTPVTLQILFLPAIFTWTSGGLPHCDSLKTPHFRVI